MTEIRLLPNHAGTLTDHESNVHTAYTSTGRSERQVSYPGRHREFRVIHERNSGGFISGTNGSGTSFRTYQEWPSFWRNAGTMFWPVTHQDIPSKEWLSTELHARTNPSKPSIDIANFIGELKDLPHMLKQVGDSYVKKKLGHATGAYNLQYQFGWKPLLGDLAKMLTIQDLVTSRFNQLRKLRDNGSTVRKVQLFNQTSTATGGGRNDHWNMALKTVRNDKIWGYTIWEPTDSFPLTDAELYALARKVALGLSIRPEVGWNLLPWSWLIDWFSNVGTFLEANNNSARLTCKVANLCYHKTFTYTAVPEKQQDPRSEDFHLDIDDMQYILDVKERFYAGPPTLTAWLPILSGQQLGILGSIYATRR